MYNEKYRQLLIKILSDGTATKCRNGKQLIIPSYSFTVDDMHDDHELTIRKMYYKGVKGEFETLIDPTPLMNVEQFEANGCNYWNNWAGPNGELNLDYHNELHPQLEDVIENIKKDPGSRRHVVSLWNHSHVAMGVLSLECCWHNLTFSVIGGTLHLTWTQRSVDTMVGLPSDVYLAYLFMKHVARECGLAIGSCMFSLSNVHIYEEHVQGALEMIKRKIDDGTPLKFEVKA